MRSLQEVLALYDGFLHRQLDFVIQRDDYLVLRGSIGATATVFAKWLAMTRQMLLDIKGMADKNEMGAAIDNDKNPSAYKEGLSKAYYSVAKYVDTHLESLRVIQAAGPADDVPSDADKYQALRTQGICDGTMHFRITDEMDAAIGKALAAAREVKS